SAGPSGDLPTLAVVQTGRNRADRIWSQAVQIVVELVERLLNARIIGVVTEIRPNLYAVDEVAMGRNVAQVWVGMSGCGQQPEQRRDSDKHCDAEKSDKRSLHLSPPPSSACP